MCAPTLLAPCLQPLSFFIVSIPFWHRHFTTVPLKSTNRQDVHFNKIPTAHVQMSTYELVWRGCNAWQHRVRRWSNDADRCDTMFDHNMLTCLEVRGRVPSYRRVTSILDRDAFEKYRDATPICLAMLWQKYALLLVDLSGYTTDVYEMHLPCVSWCFCRSIRGCQGSLAHSLAYVAQIARCNCNVWCNSIRTPPPKLSTSNVEIPYLALKSQENGRRAPAQILWWWLAMQNISVVFKIERYEMPAIRTLTIVWLAMRAPAMQNR